MALELRDPTFLRTIVAGGGCAPRDIPSDAALEFTDPSGERIYLVFYSFDRNTVRERLASVRDIVWHYASANFQQLFPEFFPAPAVA